MCHFSIRFKRYVKDIPHIWNSTYLMLKYAIPFKDAITYCCNMDHNFEYWVIDDDWIVASFICEKKKIGPGWPDPPAEPARPSPLARTGPTQPYPSQIIGPGWAPSTQTGLDQAPPVSLSGPGWAWPEPHLEVKVNTSCILISHPVPRYAWNFNRFIETV